MRGGEGMREGGVGRRGGEGMCKEREICQGTAEMCVGAVQVEVGMPVGKTCTQEGSKVALYNMAKVVWGETMYEVIITRKTMGKGQGWMQDQIQENIEHTHGSIQEQTLKLM
jgi:hypothetical protein